MADIFDVAQYILTRCSELTTMKLQKLCYYSQAWHLAWCDTPLFREEIQAWANGPVSPILYEAHKGMFTISAKDLPRGSASNLSNEELDSVKRVVDFYGGKSGYELSELTHVERPWASARGKLPLGARCSQTITHSAMAEYYQSL